MKLKNSFFFTLRENVKDEDSISSNLLVRAGYIKKNSAGIYMLMPLGLKVINNINAIIRDEMEKAGCQELLMPALIPEETYELSGRRAGFGSGMFSLKDRKGQPYVLGPTHEELFAAAAKMKIRSYKDMPFSLYQIQTKYRDEPRPRYGLIRTREFSMKDAYSFDKDESGLDISYQKQFNAYKNIMERLHLEYKIVRADTGIMGGLLSEEFQAIAPLGEDILVLCDNSDYASNIEIAECIPDKPDKDEPMEELRLIETPHAKTITEITDFFQKNARKFAKTLIYQIDNKIVAVMVRGDRDVNEVKLRKLFSATNVSLAKPETVIAITGADIGFAGPIGIQCEVVADTEVSFMQNFIVGANKTNYHYTGVNLKDFTIHHIADIRNIQEGDLSPDGKGRIYFARGIEVGNTFKLGTKYSKAMGLQYLNQDNKLQDVWMGSYGIGPARAMAALVEQKSDEKGLQWPMEIAPYQVAIVVILTKDKIQSELADEIYDKLKSNHIDVILDNRDERPGVKFTDMELIGIPLQITVGRGAKEGKIEFKVRNNESQEIFVENLLDTLKDYLPNL